MGLVGMTEVSVATLESLAVEFFQQSTGKWKSQRRYYTLNQETEPQEVESSLNITFLPQNAPELQELTQLHQLEAIDYLVCGTKVSWESNYTGKIRKPSTGSTVFGIRGNIMYRDRGFATSEPIIATFSFTNPQTLCLRTEYGGSLFEEEIKLIGDNYRTRQTIISRAGQELMIGQYLEKRV
jgi:hypothetical protein